MKQRSSLLVILAVAATAAVALTGCSGANTGSTSSSSASKYTYQSDKDGGTAIEGVKLSTIGSTPDVKGKKIAVILKSLDNQYWQGIELGVKAAAKDFGVSVTVQAASSESAQTEQLTIAQTMVNRGYDAYIMAPESSSNLTPALKLAESQGVPIVNVDDARVAATTYVGPNHELDGTYAADELARLNPNGGEVAQVEGQAGSSAATLRIKGFKEGVAKHSNLDLVASVPGNWDANQAFAATQQILQQHPNLVGIYANNDTMAIGVAKAIQNANKGDQVAVIGTDGVPEAVNGVRKGTMAATVSPLPFYEGYWAVEAAVRLLAGQKVPQWVQAPAQLITKSNVDKYYTSDGLVLPGLYK